jgi:hypothetical protein
MLTIENIKNHLILALLIFNIVFLAIYSQPKKKGYTSQLISPS